MKVYKVKDGDDIQVWYLNGQLHREDGPAYIEGNNQKWYLNGKLHREDGPAIIDGDYQEWYLNGELHREDGPAIISGSYKEWWLNGQQVKEMTMEELCKVLGYNVKIVKEKRVES